MNFRWLSREERTQRAMEGRRNAMEGWRKQSMTDKICGILAVPVALLFALVALFTAATADEHLVQKPVWLSLLQAASLVHVSMPFVFASMMFVWQVCGLTDTQVKPYGTPAFYVTIVIITALWWTSVIFAFKAAPTCAPDSSWLLSLTPSEPIRHWTLDQTILNSCHFSLASLSFAVINTVNLTVTILIGFAADVMKWFRTFLKERRQYAPVSHSEATSMETLVDRIDSGGGFTVDMTPFKPPPPRV